MQLFMSIVYNIIMNKPQIGVGPHPKPWPNDSRYDQDLLKNGDSYNVIDKYRYWTVEAIKADLDKSRVPLHIAIENWQHDFNIGTIVRAANAFNIEAVHIIGKRHWNRRGAMVTDRYMNIIFHSSVDEFENQIKKIGYDFKPVFTVLKKHGISIALLDFDVKIAAYLIDPSKSSYEFNNLISEYLDIEVS